MLFVTFLAVIKVRNVVYCYSFLTALLVPMMIPFVYLCPLPYDFMVLSPGLRYPTLNPNTFFPDMSG